MKKTLLIVLLLLCTTFIFAQSDVWLWAKQAGGTDDDYGYDIATDSSGNSYVTGCFKETASFGNTNLSSSGNYDIFVAKLDSSGNWLWAKQAGGTIHDIGYSIVIDSSGNSYVTGCFSGTASFGNITLESSGQYDIFVAKLNSSGNWLWAKQAGGTDYDIGYGIAIDSSGNSYVTGLFSGTASFRNITLESSGQYDIFVAKLDSSGNWLGANQAGGTGEDYGFSIAIDSSGNSYVTGLFSGTASFRNITLESSGQYDIFVAKLDIRGNWLWAKQAGGTSYDWGISIATDSSGNSYVTGLFSGTASFRNTNLRSSGNYDIFVAKLDGSGNWLWAKQAEGDSDSSVKGYGIAIDSSGNSYVTGLFSGTPSFGNITLTNSGYADIFVAKLDSSGNWLWAQKAGGTDHDDRLGIAIDSSGNSYVTGCFQETASFGSTNLSSSGNYDIFVAKLDSSGNWFWAQKAGGTCTDFGYDIAIDSSGNSYVTGYFAEFASFGNIKLTNRGYTDIFVAKLDSSGNCLWAKQAGGTNWDEGRGITIDSSGNSYVTGSFREIASFGSTTLTSSGDADIFVAKLDSSGNWLWVKQAGGTDYNTGCGIAIDSSGKSYVTGLFSGTASFGSTTLTSSGSTDIFIAKLDSSGNWLWAKKAGGTSPDYSWSIATDSLGNSYVTSYFWGTASFGDITLNSSGGSDIFVVKLDSSGNWLWVKQAGGTGYDESYGITTDSSGNSYVTGLFSGTASFGNITLTNSGYADIFVAKLDSSGNWLWAKQAGGTSDDYCYSIAIDSSGNSYVTGYFSGTASFGNITLESSGYNDIFVVKLDSSGNWLWAKQAGGIDYDESYGITTDSSGNSYVTGCFQGTASFGNTNLISNGYNDIFVAKLDSSGNWLWAQKAGGTDWDEGIGIATDSSGNSYVTGCFSGTASFGNITLTSNGSADIFVAKLDSSGNWLWAQKAGGTDWDKGISIATDFSGNSYVTGFFKGIASFGNITLESSGYNDIFVAKLDSNGNWLWAKKTGGTDWDEGHDIAVDSSGNSYVTGYFAEFASFGNITISSSGNADIFVAKLDSSGNWLWAKQAGGTGTDYGHGITIDSSGNSYVTGCFSGTASFGNITLESSGYNDIFVTKLNSNGNWQWAKQAGGTDKDWGYDIAIDSSGNSYVTGCFQEIASFGNTTLICRENHSIFVVKLDSTGNWLWAQKAGGTSSDRGCAIAIDSSGNSYVTGSFRGTAHFGYATITSSGNSDIFVAKLDSSGSWLGAKKGGGTDWDEGRGIAIDSSGNSYVIGYFSGTASFGNITLTSFGDSDIFVTKSLYTLRFQ